jgi:hypothetical protein
MNNAVNAPAAAGPKNAGNVNKLCRIALNIAAVYAIQLPYFVKMMRKILRFHLNNVSSLSAKPRSALAVFSAFLALTALAGL